MIRTRAWIQNALGMRMHSSSSIPNLFFKKFLRYLGIDSSSRIFIIFKNIYRRTGSHIKIPKNYSFNGEDLILSKYLPELHGSYLDIGSGNPSLGSNTYLFYRRGWSGVTIDPLERSLRKHKRRRRRDRQILGVVTGLKEANSKVIFYEYAADDFSTTSEDRYLELLKEGSKPINVRESKVIDLNQLNLSIEPLEAFLLDIDIEGGEFLVLNSINWAVFMPRVIAVEEWISPIYTPTNIRLLLEDKGYELTSRAVITSIYVHKNYLNEMQGSEV